jgi:hypothetical protein
MFTKDDFQDMMDETYPPYKILGVEFAAGRVLREVDPIFFDVLYNDFLLSKEEELENE